jgi:thioredoxin reductase
MLWFRKKGVKLYSGVREIVGISYRGLTLVTREGDRLTLGADTIVSALPLARVDGLLKELEERVPEVYAIGDCKDPLLIADAIGAGVRTAREV